MKIVWLIIIGIALATYGSNVLESITKASTSTILSLSRNRTSPQVAEGYELTATPTPLENNDIENFDGDSTINDNDKTPTGPDLKNQIPGSVLFEFDGNEPSWYTVNDDVMGGISTSSVIDDAESQQLTFSGNISLENNGGFASIRSQWADYDLSDYDGIALRVRGDGKTYRFRIRTEEAGPNIAYTALFATEADTWQEIYISFTDMVPLYRGYVVSWAGHLNPASIRSFGLMLADKQEGEFSLKVDWISAQSIIVNGVEFASLQSGLDKS